MSYFNMGGASIAATEPTSYTGIANAGYVEGMVAKNPHDGLIGFWKCDEAAGDRVDSVGDVGDLTNNGATAAAGKINNCIVCGSGGANVSAGFGANARIPGSLTLQAWVKFTAAVDVGEYWSVMGRQGNGLAFYYQMELHETGGNTRFRLRLSTTGASLNQEYNHTTNLSTATWYLLTAVYDQAGATVTLYVNETAVATAAGMTAIFDDAEGSDFFLGNYGSAGTAHNLSVDEAGIWTRPLSLAEVSAIRRNGNGASYLQVPDVEPAAAVPFGFTSDGVTIGNTTTETSLIGTLLTGSKTIAANEVRFLRTFAVSAFGTFTTIAVPGTATVRVKRGGTTIQTFTFTPAALLAATAGSVNGLFWGLTMGSAGTVDGGITFSVSGVDSQTASVYAATLDTTAAGDFDITWQWGTADVGNTLTISRVVGVVTRQ